MCDVRRVYDQNQWWALSAKNEPDLKSFDCNTNEPLAPRHNTLRLFMWCWWRWSNSWGPTCILFYIWISSGILNAQSGYKTVFSGKYLLNVGWVWINFSWKILTMSPVSGHLASEYKTSAPFPHIQCQSPSLTSWWAICTTATSVLW